MPVKFFKTDPAETVAEVFIMYDLKGRYFADSDRDCLVDLATNLDPKDFGPDFVVMSVKIDLPPIPPMKIVSEKESA